MADRTCGVVTPEALKAHDGIDFLKAIIGGALPHAPISELLGFHLTEVEPGRAVFEGLPEFRHYNPIGTVHGFHRNDARFSARLRDLLHHDQR